MFKSGPSILGDRTGARCLISTCATLFRFLYNQSAKSIAISSGKGDSSLEVSRVGSTISRYSFLLLGARGHFKSIAFFLRTKRDGPDQVNSQTSISIFIAHRAFPLTFRS